MPHTPIRFITGELTCRRTPSGRALLAAIECTALGDAQSERLLHDLRPLCTRFGGRLALEVSGVVNFSCAWINALLDLSDRCTRAGGRLVLVGPHREFTRLIRRTGLHRRIDIARSTADAFHRLGEPGFSPITRLAHWLAARLTRPILPPRAA